MKNKSAIFNIKNILPFAAALGVLLLAGCTSTMTVDITRPAALDIEDAKTVAILPFATSPQMQRYEAQGNKNIQYVQGIDMATSQDVSNRDEQRILEFLTDELEYQFAKNGSLQVIDQATVKNAIRKNKKIDADIIIYGGISYFGTNAYSNEYTNKEKNGAVKRTTLYSRIVNLTIEYTIFNQKTEKVLDTRQCKYDVESAEYEQLYNLPDPVLTCEKTISDLAYQIVRDFSIYREIKDLRLLYHKDPAMKTATTNATNGRIDLALEQFNKMYKNLNYYEAGYNAAIIMQALGDLDDAYELMSEVYSRFKERGAKQALADIQAEMIAQKKLKTQKAY